MSEPIVIVLTHETDGTARQAVGHLEAFVQRRLTRAFWRLTPEDLATTYRATHCTPEAAVDVDLLCSLADEATPSLARVFTVASSSLAGEAVAGLAQTAELLIRILRRAQPASVPIVDVRLAAPSDLLQATPLTELFS